MCWISLFFPWSSTAAAIYHSRRQRGVKLTSWQRKFGPPLSPSLCSGQEIYGWQWNNSPVVGLVSLVRSVSVGGRREEGEVKHWETKYSISRNSTKKITSINLHTHNPTEYFTEPVILYFCCKMSNLTTYMYNKLYLYSTSDGQLNVQPCQQLRYSGQHRSLTWLEECPGD